MEIALHEAYQRYCGKDLRPYFEMAYEYPLSGTPPMMTHVFENGKDTRIIAAKGAPEAMMAVSALNQQESGSISKAIDDFTKKGYRVLGVGESSYPGKEFPGTQQELSFRFAGLVAFYDPPKNNIQSVLESFYKAGIEVKIITGDNAATTQCIAEQINFRGADHVLLGKDLIRLDQTALEHAVMKRRSSPACFPTPNYL